MFTLNYFGFKMSLFCTENCDSGNVNIHINNSVIFFKRIFRFFYTSKHKIKIFIALIIAHSFLRSKIYGLNNNLIFCI